MDSYATYIFKHFATCYIYLSLGRSKGSTHGGTHEGKSSLTLLNSVEFQIYLKMGECVEIQVVGQRCWPVMLCSHLTFAFASTSPSPSDFNIARVPTRTGKTGKPGKMGRHFQVIEKSGILNRLEKSGKTMQNTGKLRII